MGNLKVGSIMGDVKLQRGDVGRVYRDVAAALRDLDIGDADIELVFDFPGELSTPDYEGIRLRKIRGGGIRAWMHVPVEELGSARLEATLFVLAAEALKAADAARGRDGVLEAANERVTGLARSSAGAIGTIPTSAPFATSDEVDEDRTIIEVRLRLADDATLPARLEQLRRLESRLDEELMVRNLGRVDGNEAGLGVYSISIDCATDKRPEIVATVRAIVADTLRETPEVHG